MKVVDLGTRLEIQDEDGMVYQRYHASTDDEGKFELSGPNFSLSAEETQVMVDWCQEWINGSKDRIVRTKDDDYYGADRKELIKFLEWRQGGCDTVRLQMTRLTNGDTYLECLVYKNDFDGYAHTVLFTESYCAEQYANEMYATYVEAFNRIYDNCGNEIGEEDD